MSAIQRDYIERMIEQCAEAIAQIVLLVRSGEFDRGLIVVQKTSDLVLGRDRAVFERLDAASVVELLGSTSWTASACMPRSWARKA